MGVRAVFFKGDGCGGGRFLRKRGGAEEKTSTSGNACSPPAKENIAGKRPFDGMEASFLAPHGSVTTFARGGGAQLTG